MKHKKILKILAFFMLLVLVNIISNSIYKNVVMGDTVVMRTQKQFDKFNFKIDYLIIGDSHLQHALDTRILKNSFNLSAAAETYILSYYKLKYILDNNLKDINTIILNIDPHSFTSGRSNRIPSPFNYYYAKFINYLELGKRKNKILPYLREYIKGTFFSFIGSREDIYNAIMRKWKNIPLINGFVPSRRNFSKMDRQRITKGRTHNQFFRNNYFDKDMVFYFEKILDLSAGKGIKVLLIKMPLDHIYYNFVLKYFDPDEWYHKIDSIIKTRKNVMVMDAQKIYFDKPHLFGDCDHLNECGAQNFTKRVINFLKNRDQSLNDFPAGEK
jgi:hypothetical protein